MAPSEFDEHLENEGWMDDEDEEDEPSFTFGLYHVHSYPHTFVTVSLLTRGYQKFLYLWVSDLQIQTLL